MDHDGKDDNDKKKLDSNGNAGRAKKKAAGGTGKIKDATINSSGKGLDKQTSNVSQNAVDFGMGGRIGNSGGGDGYRHSF